MKNKKFLIGCLLIFMALLGVAPFVAYTQVARVNTGISIARGPLHNDYVQGIIDSLLALPKYKCIFHDSYARGELTQTGEKDSGYVCSASDLDIGNNNYAIFCKDKLFYYTIATDNNQMKVGVSMFVNENGEKEYVAINEETGGTLQKTIKAVDVGVPFYRITVKKGPTQNNVAKVAFWVKDIENYYYIRLSKKKIELYKVSEGSEKRLKRYRCKNRDVISIELNKEHLEIRGKDDYHKLFSISEAEYSNICGLLFSSNEVTEISSFVVDRKSVYKNYSLNLTKDKSGEIVRKGDGYLLDAEPKKVTGSNNVLRFSLDYEADYSNHLVSNSRRSEVSLIADESPLDSWIATFDVLFPDKSNNEFYEKDSNYEIVFQAHDRYAGHGLSPQFALRVVNDEILCTIRSREVLVWKNEGSTNKKFVLAKLVNDANDKSKSDAIWLKKGDWNNIIIYVKEGYLPEHNPKTIIFFNGHKVLEDETPNAYNAGSFGSFIKAGIYKPLWKTSQLESPVKKRVLYMGDIKYFR